jgi:DNA-binding transcriptional LysR family regulator
VDIRQLHYLVALVREKHFTRAAFDCARTIVPPAIARAELVLRD